jgi:hypothetical protein
VSPQAQQLLLGIVTVALGGSVVQLIIYFLRRRSEMRALDKTSTAPLLDSAQGLIGAYKEASQRATERLDRFQAQMEQKDIEHSASMRRIQEENRRMAVEISRLQTDLAIANGQIEQLMRQLRARDQAQ